MAGIYISGTTINVTGLTVGQQYAMALYCRYPGGTSYNNVARQPSGTGTVAATSTVWTFNISNYVSASGTYSFYVHIYAPGQSPQNSNTDVVSYTTESQTIKVMVYNYLAGGTALTNGSYTGSPGGIFYITYKDTQYQTYSVIYEFMYFRMASDGYQGTYGTSTGITIQEGQEIHAYYKERITYVTITGYCGTGVSSFRMSSSGGSYQTVTATSGGIQSMQVVSGETVSFTQLTPLDDYGAPYSLYYNRSGQSGWFGPATTFNITDTSFDRRIMISATALPKPVAPTITSVSATQTTATVYWSTNGGDSSDGYWTLFYQTGTGAYTSYGTVSSSPVTITGLTAGTTYSFMIRHTIRSTTKYADSNSMSATTKNAVTAFAWTANDSVNIQTGQPVKNITASSWQALITKIAACGGNTSSIPSASAGAKITANHFNQMRAAIASLSGAGSVASGVLQNGTIYATLFANNSSALKEAVNRAITAYNQ